MKEAAAIMDNIVAKLEALSADTRHGDTQRFRHAKNVYDSEDLLDVRSATRRFVLTPTGGRELVGFLGQEGEMTSVIQSFDLSVAYAQGKNALELFKRVVEDVDQIGRELMKTSNFDNATTGLERRTVSSYSLELNEAGSTAILTIPIECRYTPAYT